MKHLLTGMAFFVFLLAPSVLQAEEEKELYGDLTRFLKLPPVTVQMSWYWSPTIDKERNVQSATAVIPQLRRKYKDLSDSASPLTRARLLFKLRDWCDRGRKPRQARKYNRLAQQVLIEAYRKQATYELCFLLGKSLRWSGDDQKARRYFLQAYAIDSSRPEIYLNLLPLRRERQNYFNYLRKWTERGVRFFEKEIENHPQKGVLYYEYIKFRMAVFNCKFRNPRHRSPSNARGFRYFMEFFKEVRPLALLEKAVSSDPEEPRYRLLRASILLGKVFFIGFSLAQREMAKFKSRGEMTEKLHKIMGGAFSLVVKREQKAMKMINRDLQYLYQRRIFGYLSLFSYLGLFEALRLNLPKSEQYFMEGVQYHRDYKKYYWDLLGIYIFLLPHNSTIFQVKALEAVQKMLKNQFITVRDEDLILSAKILCRNHLYGEAQKILSQGLRHRSKNPILLLCRAVVFLHQRKIRSAERVLKSFQVSRRSGLWGIYTFSRGILELMKGNETDGLDFVELALSYDPSIEGGKELLMLYGR